MASRFRFEQWVPFPREPVFLFFARPANLPRIMPPKSRTRIDNLRLVPPPGNHELGHLAGVGSEIVTSFRVLPFLPFRATWVALITEFEWNHHFADVQKLGPFRSFHHRHELRTEIRDGVPGTMVTDSVELDVGLGWLGKVIEKRFVRGQIQQTFQHRQKTLLRLLAPG